VSVAMGLHIAVSGLRKSGKISRPFQHMFGNYVKE